MSEGTTTTKEHEMHKVQVFMAQPPTKDNKELNKAIENEDHPLHEKAKLYWLNEFFRYHEALDYAEVFAYETDSDDTQKVLNHAFQEFNIGQSLLANEYRAKGNRSLSVGDVVVIDGDAWVCASFGWDHLDDFVGVAAA